MADFNPLSKPTKRFQALKDAAADARKPFDKDTLLNVAFFLDKQYTEWVPEWATIRDIPRPPSESRIPRPVANKIMHFVQQEHAFVMQANPTVDVIPATTGPQDLSLAAVAQSYLQTIADPQLADFEGELSDAALWALIAGESFLKWTWNKSEKRPDVIAVGPLDLYVDPYCRKFKNARYVIHSQFMDVEQVYDAYDKHVRPTSLTAADQTKAALMRELGQSPIIEGCVVNELWLKPNRRYPGGLFVTWVGDELLIEPGDFPYAHKHLPFTQLGSIPRPGSAHYTCAVKYLRSPQMELNKYHAQRLMVREKFSNPKWWLPSSLELEADPDDSPAQILRGQSPNGEKPELIQPTTFPEQTDGDWITKEMQDVVGLHEVTQGQVPGRVEAAKAIEILKESDVSRLAELERTIKGSITEGFWQWLMDVKQFGDDTQLVEAYSADGMPEVKYFKKARLKEGMRLRVTMGTGLARSRAAREDQVMNLWTNKAIQDPEVLAEMLEIPLGTITPQREFDIRLARNENLTLASGEAIKPNSWDAHEIHLREHNNYRKTQEFLASTNDIKTKFEMHCETHESLQLVEAAKQAKLGAVLAGQAPPGPEAPPGPPEPSGAAPQDQEAPPEQATDAGTGQPQSVVK